MKFVKLKLPVANAVEQLFPVLDSSSIDARTAGTWWWDEPGGNTLGYLMALSS